MRGFVAVTFKTKSPCRIMEAQPTNAVLHIRDGQKERTVKIVREVSTGMARPDTTISVYEVENVERFQRALASVFGTDILAHVVVLLA